MATARAGLSGGLGVNSEGGLLQDGLENIGDDEDCVEEVVPGCANGLS